MLSKNPQAVKRRKTMVRKFGSFEAYKEHMAGVSRLGGKASKSRRQRTHCPNGHPYTEENTYINRRGHRKCRECKQASRLRTQGEL